MHVIETTIGRSGMRYSFILMAAAFFCGASASADAQKYRLLEEQPQAEKERILRALVTSAGHPCRSVTTILFKGADDNKAGYWAVSCSNGGNWMISVENDAGGSSRIMSCEVFEAVGAGDCWEEF